MTDASTYTANQLNQRQEVTTVNIIAVMPAKVQLDNTQAKKTAETAGGIVGALAGGLIGGSAGHPWSHTAAAMTGAGAGSALGVAAGSLTDNTKTVDGVQLTYQDSRDSKVYNSAQIGKLCEFKPGTAVLVATSSSETRIQPNAACPSTN